MTNIYVLYVKDRQQKRRAVLSWFFEGQVSYSVTLG